jgi:acetyl-CoA carboxylase / biotin carboxylase 1
MARLDPEYGQLKAQSLSKNLSADELNAIKTKMTEREQLLGPIYQQIALQFADLHDRAGRMEAKGTIRMPLAWKNARRFFYWRLRRRLSEEVLVKKLNSSIASGVAPTAVAPMVQREQNLALLKNWSGLLDVEFDKDDRKVAEWYESHRKEVYAKIDAVKTDAISKRVAELLMGNKEGGLKGVREVLSLVPTAEREQLVKYLTGA